jgi:hypothetical protein
VEPLSVKGGMLTRGKLLPRPRKGFGAMDLWKQGLAAVVEKEDVSEECRRLSEAAVNLMNATENGMQF